MTDNLRALARAVLAGDATAAAGLIDCVHEEMGLGSAREWLAMWDGFAKAALDNIVLGHSWNEVAVARMARNGDEGRDKLMARASYRVATAMMAERARRLRRRAAV